MITGENEWAEVGASVDVWQEDLEAAGSPAMMIGGETVAVVEETEEKVLRLQVGVIMMDRSRSEQIRG